jgi:hypothetical protein
MIVKALARGLLSKQNLFNFTKASTATQTPPPSTQTHPSSTQTSPLHTQTLKKGQISQVIGAVVDVQF